MTVLAPVSAATDSSMKYTCYYTTGMLLGSFHSIRYKHRVSQKHNTQK